MFSSLSRDMLNHELPSLSPVSTETKKNLNISAIIYVDFHRGNRFGSIEGFFE